MVSGGHNHRMVSGTGGMVTTIVLGYPVCITDTHPGSRHIWISTDKQIDMFD